MYPRNNKPDVGSILEELTNSIRDRGDEVDLYLREGLMPIDEPMHDVFWKTLGIHRLLFNGNHSKPAITEHWNTETGNDNNVLSRWNRIKNDSIAEGLRSILSDCSIIEFADWTTVDASGFWDRLYCDVIKPLNRRDFQFIFHLSDTMKKLVFEIDEILDILDDYSSHGTVTLVLQEDEAVRLWCSLNGQNAGDFNSGFGSPQETKEKYLFLYNTIRIDSLLILHGTHAMAFSQDWQFNLAARSLNSTHEPLLAVDSFAAGYQFGLLLQLQIPHCIALGMAVSVVHEEYRSGQSSKVLLAYMQDWMTELLPANE
jgi:hypothetical protein